MGGAWRGGRPDEEREHHVQRASRRKQIKVPEEGSVAQKRPHQNLVGHGEPRGLRWGVLTSFEERGGGEGGCHVKSAPEGRRLHNCAAHSAGGEEKGTARRLEALPSGVRPAARARDSCATGLGDRAGVGVTEGWGQTGLHSDTGRGPGLGTV